MTQKTTMNFRLGKRQITVTLPKIHSSPLELGWGEITVSPSKKLGKRLVNKWERAYGDGYSEYEFEDDVEYTLRHVISFCVIDGMVLLHDFGVPQFLDDPDTSPPYPEMFKWYKGSVVAGLRAAVKLAQELKCRHLFAYITSKGYERPIAEVMRTLRWNTATEFKNLNTGNLVTHFYKNIKFPRKR